MITCFGNPSGLRDDQKQPSLPFANSLHLITLGLKVIKKRLTYSEHTWLRCCPPITLFQTQKSHISYWQHTRHRTTYFTLHEVREVVHLLNNRKSPGPDLVTTKMLKELPKKGLLTLLYIFNGILRTHHWPAVLKTAEIILLLKPDKDPKTPESYRPTSLLPTISKVLERLLANRIINDVTYTQRLPDNQFRFRHKHSTIQQMHRLCHTIYTAFEAKQYCTSAFLDVSQAFDKVWHDGLLYKIMHTLPLYYNLIRSYLSARTFHTKIKDHTSAEQD